MVSIRHPDQQGLHGDCIHTQALEESHGYSNLVKSHVGCKVFADHSDHSHNEVLMHDQSLVNGLVNHAHNQ